MFNNYFSFSFDVPNLQFFCDCVMKKINLEGKIGINGKILLAQIDGNGTFTAAVGK